MLRIITAFTLFLFSSICASQAQTDKKNIDQKFFEFDLYPFELSETTGKWGLKFKDVYDRPLALNYLKRNFHYNTKVDTLINNTWLALPFYDKFERWSYGPRFQYLVGTRGAKVDMFTLSGEILGNNVSEFLPEKVNLEKSDVVITLKTGNQWKWYYEGDFYNKNTTIYYNSPLFDKLEVVRDTVLSAFNFITKVQGVEQRYNVVGHELSGNVIASVAIVQPAEKQEIKKEVKTVQIVQEIVAVQEVNVAAAQEIAALKKQLEEEKKARVAAEQKLQAESKKLAEAEQARQVAEKRAVKEEEEKNVALKSLNEFIEKSKILAAQTPDLMQQQITREAEIKAAVEKELKAAEEKEKAVAALKAAEEAKLIAEALVKADAEQKKAEEVKATLAKALKETEEKERLAAEQKQIEEAKRIAEVEKKKIEEESAHKKAEEIKLAVEKALKEALDKEHLAAQQKAAEEVKAAEKQNEATLKKAVIENFGEIIQDRNIVMQKIVTRDKMLTYEFFKESNLSGLKNAEGKVLIYPVMKNINIIYPSNPELKYSNINAAIEFELDNMIFRITNPDFAGPDNLGNHAIKCTNCSSGFKSVEVMWDKAKGKYVY